MSAERIAEAAVARRVEVLAATLRERLPEADVEAGDGAVRLAGRGIGRRLLEDGALAELIR